MYRILRPLSLADPTRSMSPGVVRNTCPELRAGISESQEPMKTCAILMLDFSAFKMETEWFD